MAAAAEAKVILRLTWRFFAESFLMAHKDILAHRIAHRASLTACPVPCRLPWHVFCLIVLENHFRGSDCAHASKEEGVILVELWDITVAGALKRNVRRIPGKTAYIFDGIVYTWAQVDRLSDAIAVSLSRRGVRRGTHIGIWGVNSIAWVLYYLAVQKLGALAVLLNYSYKAMEMASVLTYNDVEYLLVGEPKPDLNYHQIMDVVEPQVKTLKCVWYMEEEFAGSAATEGTAAELAQLEKMQADIDCQDASTIIFTSGTTAQPKGVLLTHYGLINDARSVAAGMHWSESDIMALAMPMFHCSGLTCGVLIGMCDEMPTVILRYFSPRVVMETIEKYRCTVFNAVPSMLLIMKNHPDRGKYDLSSFVSGTMGGSAISAEEFAEVCRVFGLTNYLSVYGQTECSPIVCMSVYGDPVEITVDSIGKPLDGVEMRIWDEAANCVAKDGDMGEIQVKGFCIMKGYYNRPEFDGKKFTPDGWLRTGDIGWRDTEGYYHFTCRSDDMIIRGGENIAPSEIECCLRHYAGSVRMVRVVGVEAPIVQSEIAAFLKADEPLDPEAVRAYVKASLANFKVPKYVFQLDAFPMTASGKIDDKALRILAKQLVAEFNQQKNLSPEPNGRKEQA